MLRSETFQTTLVFRIASRKRRWTCRYYSLLNVRPRDKNSWCTMPLKSKNTVSITFTFDRTCRAFFGLGEPECLNWDDWDLLPTSFHTLCYALLYFFRKIWYKFFNPFLLTNENRRAHKNTSNLSGCHRRSKQWIQLKILSYFRGMYTNIRKKKLTIGLSKPAKLKNFRYFLNTPRMYHLRDFQGLTTSHQLFNSIP